MSGDRFEHWHVVRNNRGEVLARVFYRGERPTPVRGRMSLTEECEIMQAAMIRNDHNDRLDNDSVMAFKPHWHKPQVRTIVGTAEAWIVLAGVVWVDVYNTENNLIEKIELDRGDMFLSFAGGHGYEMAPGSEVLELKTGPYNGREQDKEMIE